MTKTPPIPEETPGIPPGLLANSPEMEQIRKAAQSVRPDQYVAPVVQETPFAPVAATHGPLSHPAPEAPVFAQPQAPQQIQIPAQPIAPMVFQAPEVDQANSHYMNRGFISMDEVLFGDPNKHNHLDDKLTALIATTQEDLINKGTNLNDARNDPEKKADLVAKIDRFVLNQLIMEGRSTEADKKYLVASVINEIMGLGPIEPIWQDPTITEVIVNGPNEVYIEQAGRLMRANGVRFRSQAHLLDVCVRILSAIGRNLDVTNPLADGRLMDGSRVNAVHHTLAPRGPLLTIRRFPQVNRTLVDLVNIGAMSQDMARLLTWLVANKASTLVVGGTGTGKALDIETPIPTPKGFIRMGDIAVGDSVFDENGKPTLVIGAYDVQNDRPCYEVVFSDGSKIIADTEHLWLTYTQDARELAKRDLRITDTYKEHSCEHGSDVRDNFIAATKTSEEEIIFNGDGSLNFKNKTRLAQNSLPAVRTTEEIRSTLLVDNQRYAHSIPLVSSPVAMKSQTLGIAPEVMGAFLAMDKDARADFLLFNKQLAKTILKENLADESGIPMKYLFSSVKQRQALLEGFASVIGGVSQSGYSWLTTESEKMSEDLLVLISSLGLPAQRYKETPSGVTQQLYTLEYNENELDVHRYIVAVNPVASRPVRCIRVVNESHLFLAGPSFIPTHNTTLLNALSAAIPRNERVITIEDSLELRLHASSHVAAMEARPKDAKSQNAIKIKDLVKNALRMRPDRIIVGEVRGEEALNMLEACNTGHEGSMSTIHANGSNEALARLAVMIAQGGEMPSDKVDWLVGSALDLMIQIKRFKDGSRRVSGIYEVPDIYALEEGQSMKTIPLWEWRRSGEDSEGRFIGEYVKLHEISEGLRLKLGLDFEPYPEWSDVQAVCLD